MVIAFLCIAAIVVVVAMVATLVLIERAARRRGTVKNVEQAVRDEEFDEGVEWAEVHTW